MTTPWCAVKLLQIDPEVRAWAESLVPAAVEHVRVNHGFADEDARALAHRRAHEAASQQTERLRVVQTDTSLQLPGTATWQELVQAAGTDLAVDAPVEFEDRPLDGDGSRDGRSDSATISAGTLVHSANVARSMWELDLAENGIATAPATGPTNAATPAAGDSVQEQHVRELTARIRTLETELKTGASFREVDDIQRDIEVAKAHLTKIQPSRRFIGWS